MKHKHACTQTGTECDMESDGKVCWVQTAELEGTAKPCAVTLCAALTLPGLDTGSGALRTHWLEEWTVTRCSPDGSGRKGKHRHV